MNDTRKIEFQWKRIIFHSGWGWLAIPVALLLQKGMLSVGQLDIFIYGVMLPITIIVDLMRPILYWSNLRWKWMEKNKYLNLLLLLEKWFVGIKILREKERLRYSGMGMYLIGIITVYSFFQFYIGVIAVMILAFGDPIASIVGKAYGTPYDSLDGKSYEGVVSFVAGSFIIIILLVSFFDSLSLPFFPVDFTMWEKVRIISVGTVIGSIVEVKAGSLDNLLIPIITAIVMTLLI